MKDALIEYETIDAGQIDDIMNGRIPRKPADWNDDVQRPGRPASPDTIAPVAGPKPTLGKPASEH